MGEQDGRRAAIDRMAKQIIDTNQGRVSADKARTIARDAAIRADRRDKKQ
jgi:hypothetical protein|tara:strand:+ start:1052 stop:1201 length:150 start_codon:yes stop_codon:yes gene_type:complete